MRDLIIRTFALFFATAMIAAILVNPDNHSSAMNLNPDNNPLLAKWEGPHGGTPPFDRVDHGVTMDNSSKTTAQAP
jgi:hypothetical protein